MFSRRKRNDPEYVASAPPHGQALTDGMLGKRGVLIPLHKFDDTVIVFPSHTLHLSQKLDRTAQLMRSIGHIRYMFIYEEFATNDLDGMQVI